MGICGDGTSGPLSGSAHFRIDGSAHFAVHAISATHPPCGSVSYEGTLNPPFFNTGSGAYRNAFERVDIPFTPAASCPDVPGLPEKPAGAAAGNGLPRP